MFVAALGTVEENDYNGEVEFDDPFADFDDDEIPVVPAFVSRKLDRNKFYPILPKQLVMQKRFKRPSKYNVPVDSTEAETMHSGPCKPPKSIGKGGNAEVFEFVCTHGDGVTVNLAVKRFSQTDLFALEVEGLSTLTRALDANKRKWCPNLLQLREVCCDKVGGYVLYERLHALPLSKWKDRHVSRTSRLFEVDNSRFVYVMKQVAKTLKCLTEMGLVHNDVKPDNIFYDKKQVTVIDLGGIRPAFDPDLNKYVTPPYCPYDATRTTLSDVYALGMTGIELRTGELPLVPQGHGIGELTMWCENNQIDYSEFNEHWNRKCKIVDDELFNFLLTMIRRKLDDRPFMHQVFDFFMQTLRDLTFDDNDLSGWILRQEEGDESTDIAPEETNESDTENYHNDKGSIDIETDIHDIFSSISSSKAMPPVSPLSRARTETFFPLRPPN
jgi:serine/threonine protein kinase